MRLSQIFKHWGTWVFAPSLLVRRKYEIFKELMYRDKNALDMIARLEEMYFRAIPTEYNQIRKICDYLSLEVSQLLDLLSNLKPNLDKALYHSFHKIESSIQETLFQEEVNCSKPYVLPLDNQIDEALAGGKGSNISKVCSELQLPTPKGFVITTRAGHLFLKVNNLLSPIDRVLEQIDLKDKQGLIQASQNIHDWIMEADMPLKLIKEIENWFQRSGLTGSQLAFRSSAVGEDSSLSFAGQFLSLLNVGNQDWIDAFKRILASKYSPSALTYRIRGGLPDQQVAMAVLVMEMIPALTSGIMYSQIGQKKPVVSIYMVRGLGDSLASGQGHELSLLAYPTLQRVEGDPTSLGLDLETVLELSEQARILEEFFGCPQDIEWSIDQENRFYILQSRPLYLEKSASRKIDYHLEAPVLLHGEWASPGRAVGKVFKWDQTPLPPEIPDKAILVVRSLKPSLVLGIDRVKAVLAEKGSPACHFASVAREVGLPVLVEVKGVMELEEGLEISVDADLGEIYPGMIIEERDDRSSLSKSETESWVQKKLHELLEFIASLHFTDPQADDFSAQACRSIHDIVRFIHEEGIREMFSLVGRRGLDRLGVKRLTSTLPLVMHVLDVNQGLSAKSLSQKEVSPDDFESRPMKALWQGLSDPDVKWDPSILHYDWEEYNRHEFVFINVEKSTLLGSYAVLARDYVHAQLRFGYHFAVVDVLLTENSEQNYLQFSFKGGGGHFDQRLLRLKIVSDTLEKYGFQCSLVGDFLKANFDRGDQQETEIRTYILGFVLGKTVLLDMRLSSPEQTRKWSYEIISELDRKCFLS